jgi:hypothetical protein
MANLYSQGKIDEAIYDLHDINRLVVAERTDWRIDVAQRLIKHRNNIDKLISHLSIEQGKAIP